jgi:hypothetical protein
MCVRTDNTQAHLHRCQKNGDIYPIYELLNLQHPVKAPFLIEKSGN